jgi:hypothetical protein
MEVSDYAHELVALPMFRGKIIDCASTLFHQGERIKARCKLGEQR